MKAKINAYLIVVLAVFFSVFSSFNATANLLISPTRIVFDERTRTAKVYIINNSNERRTYRLGWQEKAAQPLGGYEDLPALTDSSLSPMIRMSPSQLTLAPGERQVVKLAIRKRKDLKAQEYRSHLQFKALPNQKALSQKQLGININMVLSYSIPVLYRAEKNIPKVSITSVQVQQPDLLKVSVEKSGNYSSFGQFEVWFTPQNSDTPQRIAVQPHTSIYAELQNATVELRAIDGFKFNQKGSIKVNYIGQQEYADHTFAQYSVPFSL